jgi:hypothetical protein
MARLKIQRIIFPVLLACGLLLCLPALSLAQTSERGAAPLMDVDLECQLHLLVASNAAADSARLSAPLEAIARELKPMLPFTNYRLGATFLGRVKNGRPLSVRGVGRTLLVTPALESSANPTFYEISAGTVTLKSDGGSREVVQLAPFRFGLRIPLHNTQGAGGADAKGGVVYESAGITTDVTLREGEPVVIGTLDAGRPNETLILVLVAKRAAH